MFGFRPIHLFTVLFSEEEPVGESHVKELCVAPVQSHEVQSLAIAVSATEERPRLPLFPGVSSSLLHCQRRQGNPGRPTEVRVHMDMAVYLYVQHVSKNTLYDRVRVVGYIAG